MSKIISYHNFMFPFRFDKITKEAKGLDRHKYYKKEPFDERVDIKSLLEYLVNLDSRWKYEQFEIESNLDYNEYTYYHDFVRDALYNEHKKSIAGETSYFFKQDIGASDRYCIGIKDGKTYTLDLVGLSLRIFDTGVGILSIELNNTNPSQSSLDDILKINEYGRRVYPQYLSKGENDDWAEGTKGSFLADFIEISYGDKQVRESFEYKEIPKKIELAQFIKDLLGDPFCYKIDEKDNQDKFLIRPIIDDRMFTICWYGNNEVSETLRDNNYQESDTWYEFVYIDGNGKTVHSPSMQKELIEKATYDRWMDFEYGLTLYGMSRYSFVCLSNASEYSQNVLPLPHMRTMYYQMFTLLLAQRASILRFSDEVSALSDLGEEEQKELSEKSRILYKNYIRFVNKLYFREVTAQDQGIELYDMARDVMRIDKDIKDLDEEIAELHSYVDMQEEKSRNDRLELISKLGAVFLPPTLLAGMFGMNFIDFDQHNPFYSFVAILIILLSAFAGFVAVESKTKFLKISMIVLIFIFFFGSVFCYPYPNDDNGVKNGSFCGLYTKGGR